jgi:hypothetical protein
MFKLAEFLDLLILPMLHSSSRVEFGQTRIMGKEDRVRLGTMLTQFDFSPQIDTNARKMLHIDTNMA